MVCESGERLAVVLANSEKLEQLGLPAGFVGSVEAKIRKAGAGGGCMSKGCSKKSYHQEAPSKTGRA